MLGMQGAYGDAVRRKARAGGSGSSGGRFCGQKRSCFT
jgi:hypothetical protein